MQSSVVSAGVEDRVVSAGVEGRVVSGMKVGSFTYSCPNAAVAAESGFIPQCVDLASDSGLSDW